MKIMVWMTVRGASNLMSLIQVKGFRKMCQEVQEKRLNVVKTGTIKVDNKKQTNQKEALPRSRDHIVLIILKRYKHSRQICMDSSLK